MKILFWQLFFIFLLFTFALNVKAQNCKGSKSDNDFQAGCANLVNEINEFNTLKSIKGKVTALTGEAILSAIEVYEVSPTEKDLGAYDIVQNKSPIKKIETNVNGEFCLKKLPAGFYVLKIGSNSLSGFNCLWIKVELSKKGSKKSLEIELTPGI